MDKSLGTVIIVAAVVLMLGSMLLSWWARGKRQSGYPQLPPVPTELDVKAEFAGLYLATTPSGAPLDRVAVRGLGFRARTSVLIATEGLVFIGDRFIPADHIREVGSASWTIDRGVSKDGLSVVSWTLGETELDSYFRLDDPAGFLATANALIETGSK